MAWEVTGRTAWLGMAVARPWKSQAAAQRVTESGSASCPGVLCEFNIEREEGRKTNLTCDTMLHCCGRAWKDRSIQANGATGSIGTEEGKAGT
jgi:hypothetical protein